MMSKTGKPSLPCFGKESMEERIQKIIQTVTAGLILGMLAAVLFLMLLKSTGYTPTLLFGIGLIIIAFFLPQCLRILPEKWFYPLAVAWTMSVTSLFICTGYVLFVTWNTGHGIMGNMMNGVLFINLTMLVSTGISTAWKLRHRGK